jgi:GNAT superfamily N-acetyltransferase
MINKIRFRNVIRPGDPEIIREIGESTGFFYPDEVDLTEKLALECLNNGESSGYYYIFAEAPDGCTVAYCCYGPVPCTKRSFSIYWIAVHAGQQRKGIGKHLIAETEKKVIEMGGKTIYLDTASRPLYEPTRRFYLRCNYIAEAQFKDYYDFGDDKIVFVKRF